MFIADVDYGRLDGVEVTFDPGVFIQTVTVNTINDVPAEENEDFQALLTAITSGVDVTAGTALVTISDEGIRIHRYSECAYCIYVYTCTLYSP